MNEKQVGYPSLDKPWLKFYSDEAINAPLPDCSLYEYLWDCNKNHLDDNALNYFGTKITYRKLFSMIDEASKAFIAVGIKEKEIVPIVSVSTVTSVVCFYALNKIGAVSDFLNVLSEEHDFKTLFEEVDARTVVTLDLFAPKVVGAAKNSCVERIITFCIDQNMPLHIRLGYKLKTLGKLQKISAVTHLISWDEFIGKSSEVKEINRKKNPNEICLLAHTGGTTGIPKAVMLDDCSMNAVAAQQRSIYIKLPEYEKKATFLQVIVPFVVYGILTCTHMPLCMGWCVALIPKFEESEWHNYFRKYHFSYVLAVPSYITGMIDNPRLQGQDLSDLRIIAAGGDGVTDTIENKVNEFLSCHGSSARLEKGYGMTEVCAAGLITFPSCNRVGSVGIPLPKNNLMIFDNESEKELSYGEIGEVCLQCPSRMQGYMNNDDETSMLFRIHKDGQEWLHTGDLGYVDEDGFLFLVGRMKRVIMTTGNGVTYKVFPNIPERILNSHELVLQSCIVGAVDNENQVLRAYVVIADTNKGKEKVIEKELRSLCDKNLPSYSRPTFYVFCNSLPLTAAGKVDYMALEKK